MKPLLSIDNLQVACDDKPIIFSASLDVGEHEIVALVGESGSGKSMIARCIMRLPPSPSIKIVSGRIDFQGTSLSELSERKMQRMRGRLIAYIPQSPMNALNPIMSIGRQLVETFDPSCKTGSSGYERALFLLKRVGFIHPEQTMRSLPCQLSGGMRQRVLIAMALMNAPRLLIADEPTTALDVTLQAEILDLLEDLQRECGLSILLITHDLGIVARCAQRVAILRAGRTVEHATVDDLFYRPKTAYTRLLLDSLIANPTHRAAV